MYYRNLRFDVSSNWPLYQQKITLSAQQSSQSYEFGRRVGGGDKKLTNVYSVLYYCSYCHSRCYVPLKELWRAPASTSDDDRLLENLGMHM